MNPAPEYEDIAREHWGKHKQIVQAPHLSERTVQRDWDKARLLLAHSLRG